jgi:hypothetical protein
MALGEHLDEVRSETVISLNETVRRRERDEMKQQRLDLENIRRRDERQEPITELSELESDATSAAQGNEDEEPREDPVLIEAAHILLDYVELTAPKIAQP